MTSEVIFHKTLYIIRDVLESMGLPRIESGRVVVRKLPFSDREMYTGITLYPMAERESYGTTSRDDIGYVTGVCIAERTTKGMRENMENILECRTRIRRRFHNKRLPEYDGRDGHVIQCKVSHGGVEIPKQFYENIDYQQLTIISWFREYRTDPT